MPPIGRLWHGPAAILAMLVGPLLAAEGPSKPLLAVSADGVGNRLAPTSDQVTVARSQDPNAPGLVVTIQPGKESYPGTDLKPEGASWDLSAFGHVEARIANTGAKPISVSLRVDNAGDWRDEPWNTESVSLKPGASGTVRTIFGHSYGHKPGYALKPAAVVKVMLFAGKSDVVQSFRIESIQAGGPAGEKPPVDPKSVRIKPKDGILLGAGVVIDANQIASKGAPASMVAQGDRPSLKVTFPAAKGEQSAALKPTMGRWDLRDCLEVRVKVRNDGQAALTPRIRLESDGGPSDWAGTAAPLAPGAAAEIVVPFISAAIWNGRKDAGSRVYHDAFSAVTISAEQADAERVLLVESIKAGMPPAPEMSDWLGKRPPTPGDWVKTFDDEFDGNAIDSSKWNIYGENYWDKKSHFSKDNTIIGGGVVRLRFQKKHGHQNDDPNHQRVTDYATGFLDTYGKWTQRYGYLEARMKLPTAPGLWPAFWMMPDRGVATDPQWKRQSTADGGMELDIMEHLTRWGPNRYNMAMHWDGYGKDHKSVGSDRIYVQPDKEGWLTSGLLWTPGSLVFYCNGREVAKWEDPRVGNVPAIMMFTLPMGGWDNSSLDDARLPDDFVIDYVRVWQRRDLAPDADGKKPQANP